MTLRVSHTPLYTLRSATRHLPHATQSHLATPLLSHTLMMLRVSCTYVTEPTSDKRGGVACSRQCL